MKKTPFYGWLLAVGLLLTACNGLRGSNPVLLEESTYIPTVAVLPSITPTPVPSNTFTPVPTLVLPATSTFVLITPTLPPTRTPTQTFTPSDTPTQTFTPSDTPPPTPVPTNTLPPPPTFGPVAPPQPPVGQPTAAGVSVAPANVAAPPAPVDGGGGCLYQWFFSTPAEPACPVNAPQATQAAYLEFEGGRMFWFGADRMIYVLYNDGQFPRWERYPDTWQEGMPERDPNLVGPLGLWQQPRRGFGQLWRNNVVVRGRLSWALHEWETPFNGTMQQAGAEGGSTMFITGPDGSLYRLAGDQSAWEVFPP